MFRIDNSTAAGALPTPAAAGTAGYFTDGNPSTGVPATVVPADWLNATQEELMAIVAAASITPSKTNRTQVLAAITALRGRGAVLCLASVGSAPNNSEYTVVFPTPVFDDMGFYAAGAPTRLTIPAGISRVKVNGQITFAANGTGGRKMRILKNGNTEGVGLPVIRVGTPDSGDVTALSAASAIYPVVAGDYFEVLVYQNSGVALALSPASLNWVSIEAVR